MNKHGYEAAHCNSKVARLSGLLGLCLVGFLLSVPLSLAQTGQGTVTGTVTDLTQAIVPNANVTLTNTATGVANKAQSSDLGTYHFGAVPIGDYKIVVEKQGFDVWGGTFTLSVGQNAVVNPTLKVGAGKTVVEVTGAAAPIETQSGAVADVKESTQIRNLPLNGRQIGLLFDLTPGVESGAGGARVNGMKVGALDINMDGASLVNRFSGGFVTVQPGIETIQEFRVETVGSDARYDQPATVVMASRSGTNQIHGVGYEYLRDNSVVGATRLRTDPTTGFTVPKLIRNEFGGFLSGPVYIPHVYNGKDRAFWFFDYEALRNRQRSGTPLEPFVPTAAMWQGNLSNAIDPGNNNAPVVVYNPTTTNATTFQRTPFAGNIIPGTFSPTAQALKALTALPSNTNNPYLGVANITTTYPIVQSNGSPTIKWDQNISDKDRLSVRYTRASQTYVREGGYYANPLNPLSGMGSSARNYETTNVAVNYNRTISPNWLNELLVGVLREPNHSGTSADFTNWDSKLGVPDPFGVTGWPTMYVYEAPGNYFGWDSDNNKQQHLASETIEDNVTWTHSKHTFQFGFRGRKEQNNIEELQQAQGSHTWGPSYASQYTEWTGNWDPSAFTHATDTGSGFAELLLGLPTYLSDQLNRGFFYFRQTEMGLYISDKYKVSPRLTLNLGLRWDYFTPYTEARNRIVLPYAPDSKFAVMTPGNIPITQLGTPASAINAFSAIGLTYTTASAAGYPSDLFSQVYHDLGPRLGLAYQVNHNTVIRASYGIYYVPEPLNLLLQSARTTPPLNLVYQTAPNLNVNVPSSGPGQTGKNSAYYGQYPEIVAPSASDYLPPATVTAGAGGVANTENNLATTWDAKNWNDSRDQTWNFTIEHELPAHTAMRLSYIGTYGGNMLQNYAINDPEPNYNYAVRTGLIPPGDSNYLRGVLNWGLYGNNHTGYSRDHSFQAEVRRTFTNGASFQVFYTFTRQLGTDDPGGAGLSSTSVNGGGGAGHLGGSGGGAVPENFELLGEPNLTYAQRERLVYFNSTTIPPHNVTFNGVYDLPFGKGKHFARNSSTALNYLIGGWEIASIGVWHSGLWMGLANNLVQPGNVRIPAGSRPILHQAGNSKSDTFREWFAGNFPTSSYTAASGSIVTPVARLAGPNCTGGYDGHFAVPLSNAPSNNGATCYNAGFSGFYNPAPRNNIIGPGAWNDDFSIYKHFKIAEKVDLRFAADFFNFTNHPNDPPPSASTGLQDISQQDQTLNTSRQIQLSLRLEF